MPVGGLESSVTYAYWDGHLTGFGGATAAVFKDGKVVGFEGARCLFICNTIPKRFGINVDDIVHRYVTDFNAKSLIDVDKAIFVFGVQSHSLFHKGRSGRNSSPSEAANASWD
jgi:hypothetical protein